jgi:hypothetical protein
MAQNGTKSYILDSGVMGAILDEMFSEPPTISLSLQLELGDDVALSQAFNSTHKS